MFELTVAMKHITSNPKMVIFAILSVALSVAVIVISMGLIESYSSEIVWSTVENNPHVTVEPKENEEYIWLYRTLTTKVESYPGVLAVSPRLLGRAGARYKDEVKGINFIGADPLREDPLLGVQNDMVWGNYSDLIFNERSAVVGTRLAKDLGLEPGDDFELVRQNVSLSVRSVGFIETGTACCRPD